MNLPAKTSAAIAATSLYLFTAVQVFADNEIVPGEAGLVTVGERATVNTVIRWVILLMVGIGIIAALLFLIWGAIKWIISGGDKEKVAAARGHIIAAIIGLVVLLLAVVILNFVMGLIGAGNVLDPHIPSLDCYLDAANSESECGGSPLLNPAD